MIMSQFVAIGDSASYSSGHFSSLSSRRAILTARNSVGLSRSTSSSGRSISAVSTLRSRWRSDAAARCAWKSSNPLTPTTQIRCADKGQTGTSGELSQVERNVPSGVTRWCACCTSPYNCAPLALSSVCACCASVRTFCAPKRE